MPVKIVLLEMQFDVRIAPQGAGSGARRIEQNVTKGSTIPPIRPGSVAFAEIQRVPKTGCDRPRVGEPAAICIEAVETNRGVWAKILDEVIELTARRAARIEIVGIVNRVHERGGDPTRELGAKVLNRNPTVAPLG